MSISNSTFIKFPRGEQKAVEKVALQDEEGGCGFPRGFTHYYLIIVKDGIAQAQYVVYGDNGGMLGVMGTISEQIDLMSISSCCHLKVALISLVFLRLKYYLINNRSH